MKRLVAGFCAVGMLATISADEPVAGWNLARWGMTTAEIQAVYPNTKTVKRDSWDFGGRNYYSYLMLTGTTIAGYDFTVRFWMDSSDRLASVGLAKDFNKDPGHVQVRVTSGKIAYDEVKELLVQKYGRPTTEKQSEPRDSVQSLRSVWHGSNAQIALSYVCLPPSAPHVILAYAKPGDTDKL